MLNEIRIRRDKARTMVNCGRDGGLRGHQTLRFFGCCQPTLAGTSMASYKHNVRRYDIACNEEPTNKSGIRWQQARGQRPNSARNFVENATARLACQTNAHIVGMLARATKHSPCAGAWSCSEMPPKWNARSAIRRPTARASLLPSTPRTRRLPPLPPGRSAPVRRARNGPAFATGQSSASATCATMSSSAPSSPERPSGGWWRNGCARSTTALSCGSLPPSCNKCRPRACWIICAI